MDSHWKLQTNGDPLGAVRSFLRDLWAHAAIDGILIPLRDPESGEITPYLVDTPEQLESADPFAPVMRQNAATLVVELTQEYPYNRFAAVLRPCELRALTEMIKHDLFNRERVFLIGVDCLATVTKDKNGKGQQRIRGKNQLANEFLRFTGAGEIPESSYRMACQMCEAPAPQVGDLFISVLGLPIHEVLLISVESPRDSYRLHLGEITNGTAGDALVKQNERMVERIATKGKKIRAQVTPPLLVRLPADVNHLIAWLDNCGECQRCLEACPICSIKFPQKGPDGRYDRWSVIRWLVSCSDCGMCEQACPADLPLAIVLGNIRRELARACGYTPGISLADPLPY